MESKNKVFVISLHDEHKRRRSIAEQLEAQGVGYSFIDALDLRGKKSLSKQEYYLESTALDVMGRQLTAGEIGCAVSHRWAYRQVLQDGLNFALILEDDAIVTGDIKKLFNYLEKVELGWDVIFLGYSKLAPSDAFRFYKMEPIGEPVFFYLDYKLGRVWRNWTCGTVGYLISRSGALKLSQASDKVCVVADGWEFFEKKFDLKIFHHRPSIVYEDFSSFTSSIQGERAVLLKRERKYLDGVRILRGLFRGFMIRIRGNK